jgi:hypothetical protein
LPVAIKAIWGFEKVVMHVPLLCKVATPYQNEARSDFGKINMKTAIQKVKNFSPFECLFIADFFYY